MKEMKNKKYESRRERAESGDNEEKGKNKKMKKKKKMRRIKNIQRAKIERDGLTKWCGRKTKEKKVKERKR